MHRARKRNQSRKNNTPSYAFDSVAGTTLHYINRACGADDLKTIINDCENCNIQFDCDHYKGRMSVGI